MNFVLKLVRGIGKIYLYYLKAVLFLVLPHSGRHLYGRVDRVSGVFLVATQFFHICFIPVFPFRSYVVLHNGKGAGYGASIGLSLKSVAITYVRLVLLYLVVMSLLVGLVIYFDDSLKPQHRGALYMMGTGLVCFLLFIVSLRARWIVYASFGKALYLASKANLPDQMTAKIKVLYGRANEADRQIASRPATPLNAYAVKLGE